LDSTLKHRKEGRGGREGEKKNSDGDAGRRFNREGKKRKGQGASVGPRSTSLALWEKHDGLQAHDRHGNEGKTTRKMTATQRQDRRGEKVKRQE